MTKLSFQEAFGHIGGRKMSPFLWLQAKALKDCIYLILLRGVGELLVKEKLLLIAYPLCSHLTSESL